MSFNTPTLFVVATPIGNLGDMTPRAIETLESVDLVAAEDTRHSGRLLQHFGIKTPMWALHDHNERGQVDKIIERLSGGDSIALISDAGTPLISDPGYHVVNQVRAAGHAVVAVPGCCAVVTALSVAGLPTDRFVFEGFLPAKTKARLDRLEAVAQETRTLVYYESPHRLLDSLEAMQMAFGADRHVVLARELTKTFETVKGAELAELIAWVKADSNQQKGEFVLMVAGAPAVSEDEQDAEVLRVLTCLLKDLPLKQAVALTVELTGVKRKGVYQKALELKDELASE